MIDLSFWKNKRVFVTGHTGFKGSWLCLWLHAVGAKVTGYALKPLTDPNLFEVAGVAAVTDSIIADVRDGDRLQKAIAAAKPEIVFHLAAQALVRASYSAPVETYATNVMGTVNLLDALRQIGGVRAMVNVTTDKVYENRERIGGYRENEPLGGFDPYSNSKACSELVTAAYRSSFFKGKYSLASARAGNVIGGGDWAEDRLIPDCMRAFAKNKQVIIRNPGSVRPWQFVLEPLSGYLMLAEKLSTEGDVFAAAWNFGPDDRDQMPVGKIVEEVCRQWGSDAGFAVKRKPGDLHEAGCLTLDCSKAKLLLGWRPRLSLDKAIAMTVEWYKEFYRGERMRQVSMEQLDEYEELWAETSQTYPGADA
jgi:CDP-glucose 4,6-dehydratase